MNAEQLPEIQAGDVVERYVDADGGQWVRIWVVEIPGLLHLVWQKVKP